jgi:hypothetical protein
MPDRDPNKHKHDFTVVDTVSREAIKDGRSRKYNKWFRLGNQANIKVLTVRRLRCKADTCGRKRTTVEIYGATFEDVIERLEELEELRQEQTQRVETIKRLKTDMRKLRTKIATYKEKDD